MRWIDTWKGLATLLSLLVAVLGFSPAAHAQVIRGIVIDVASQAAVPGTTVELRGAGLDTALRTVTDTFGHFVLVPPTAGTFLIQARHIGFVTPAPDTLHVEDGESLTLEMRLDARAVALQPVIVTVRTEELTEFEKRRRVNAFGRFMTREDIESRAPQYTTDLFRMMPGFVLTTPRRGAPVQNLLMRGTAGLCRPAVWIDGASVPFDHGLTVDNLLPPQVIEGVEIYNAAAAAPSQYRTGACGVVLFWTRRGSRTEGDGFHWKEIAVGAGAAALIILLLFR